MIEIKSVSKQYAQTTAQEWALKDVSFQIDATSLDTNPTNKTSNKLSTICSIEQMN